MWEWGKKDEEKGVKFDSSELDMKLRHAIYDKKKNTFSNQNIDETQIVLKLSENFDNTAFTSEPLPDGIIYGISTQDILIQDSYLQMIEEIECDRKDGVTKGCTLIGSPGIGKLLKLIISHLMIKSACSEGGTGYVPSLYLAFYLTRRYTSANIIYQQPDGGNVTVTLLINQQNRSVIKFPGGLEMKTHTKNSFYIADSIAPSLCKTIYTFLRRKFGMFANGMSSIGSKYLKLKLRNWLGYGVAYHEERGDLNDNYTGKAIYITPNSDFTDRKYVPVSTEICEAMYGHHERKAY
ncbi:hypothetical protein GLOIN_2v1779548 [Rhizophagus irregularis DAOM 181602=DAOM 197198]|uniref:Uncharacterized protein n=1 Tax=Rhizophagus irregularis (strain DAOM 181602 / DAOM 197198 / MUCL 43194) TaxID=747089 RepID=A0A2P4PPK0_RHIID|nr:hypothetical protein GLOIN_2v1779548 [Rhizophagus irregularis DAOM 181602=DAOM 197198]POG67313.1 hypothetical protein GLOIN_2v1779548 [Rhizophagus irregularis DAOM 181602=DAOM 197198]|eukprot:XP_025174179.1 hypothetical protein GLOIN_2v1779548 [Rhizophagus irregularis DAOM 181602=DAOM 197198]